MPKSNEKWGIWIAALLCAFAVAGCSGHSTASKAVSVVIANKPTSVVAGSTSTLTASVTNDAADEGVTWTIAPATGAGTISSTTTTSVIYTAPATPPATNSVTITATSVADTTKSDSVTFTIAAKTPPVVSVSITNKISTITAGAAAVTLNATVTNDTGNAGVTWTLTAGGAACSPTCGTIPGPTGTSVAYMPPATAPAAPNNAPVITATSVTDTTKSDSDTITIQAASQTGITVSITNKFATVVAGSANVTVNAAVTNDPKNDGVDWSLTTGGAACSPACGTLIDPTQFTLTYSPPTTPGAAPDNTPTITATSHTDATKSDSFSFTINAAAADLGLLKGRYTAVLQGGDQKLNPRAMGINFTADGSGRITEFGLALNEDFNLTLGEGPVQGTYTVDTSFENSIRGQISIPNYSLPAFPGDTAGSQLGFVFVLAADGKSGNIEERDAGLSVISGKLYQQDPNAFSIDSLAGNFAFGAATAFNGNQTSNNNWQAMVGRFTLSDADGSFQNALIDTSTAQTGPGLSDAKLAGGWTAPDSDGQMNMNLFPAGASELTLKAFVVNASKVLFVEIDNTSGGGTTIFAGDATHQAALTASSLNGASVFWANGQENITGTMGSSAAAGRFAFTNGTSANVQYDRSYDQSGAPASNTGISLPVTLDTSSGRATITFSGGAAKSLFDSAVLYVCDANSGYLLDMTDSSKAESLFGQFVPQAAGPFDSTFLSGNLLAMQGGYESREAAQFFGGFIVSSPSGSFDTFDYSQNTSGTIQIGTDTGDATNVLDGIDATSGRGTGKFDPAGKQCSTDAVCNAAFYLIGKNQAVMVSQPAAAPSTQQDSSITFLDPQ
jgi:hypothetical protein